MLLFWADFENQGLGNNRVSYNLTDRRRQMLDRYHPVQATISAPAQGKLEITPEGLCAVCLRAAEEMVKDGAWTANDVSVDAGNKPANVYSSDAVARDGLGWILKAAYDLSAGQLSRKNVGYTFSEFIDSAIRSMTSNTFRLNTVSDLGPEKLSALLIRVAHTFANQLPEPYLYAKESRITSGQKHAA